MNTGLWKRISLAALGMLAEAALAGSPAQETASSALASPESGPATLPRANPHALTRDQLLKMIRLNRRIGTSQEIIGPAATALRLTRNQDLPVHGLGYAFKDGHSVDFAQFREDADGFVFTETNREGNFMFRVDSVLNPIRAVRIIGATSLAPLEVVPLALDAPEARTNLEAAFSTWARIIDKLSADSDRTAASP